ncbi:MAG TPA: DUF3499 family protein [Actinobacteria bacterium]|nr:hypothetical protein BMS3Bbin02_00914 [bacterium BMS3Bbin02]HDL41783.1 DUF3499 family protein [Actinomycetota bacterium]
MAGGPPNFLHMVPLCVRCSQPAVAVMRYNYAARSVSLEPLVHVPSPGAGYLMCARHADRVMPPVGWGRVDRRRLFVVTGLKR